MPTATVGCAIAQISMQDLPCAPDAPGWRVIDVHTPQEVAMRKALLSAVVVGLFAVPAIGMSATKSVSVRDNSFSPKSLTISKGDTVRWRWAGRAPHNVSGRGFRSRTQRSGSYSRRFRSSGRFRVVCTIHPGMAMTVRVR